MASYNDVFGDDDSPSWLTATKESDDEEVNCFFSVSGTGGLPPLDGSVMHSSQSSFGQATFALWQVSAMQRSGWGRSRGCVLLHAQWTNWINDSGMENWTTIASAEVFEWNGMEWSGEWLQDIHSGLNLAWARQSTLRQHRQHLCCYGCRCPTRRWISRFRNGYEDRGKWLKMRRSAQDFLAGWTNLRRAEAMQFCTRWRLRLQMLENSNDLTRKLLSDQLWLIAATSDMS